MSSLSMLLPLALASFIGSSVGGPLFYPPVGVTAAASLPCSPAVGVVADPLNWVAGGDDRAARKLPYVFSCALIDVRMGVA